MVVGMMVPEVDMSEKLDITTMEASPVSIKENGSSVKLPEEKLVVCASNCEHHAFVDVVDKTPEDNLMIPCGSSYEDISFDMEVPAVDCDQVVASKGNKEDVEVEIVESVVSDEEMVVERESLDATENSSSFGCTDSGTGTAGASSDGEVESQVQEDNASLMEFDGFNDLFKARKKKLTAHWRKFIRPLMWRCKWVELHIRELRSQASKYDRELAECGRRKLSEFEKCAAEDVAVKSVSSVYQNQPVRVMKRKKRKRAEEIENLAAYSSCHSLFSYFASKKPSGDSVYLDDDHGNIGKNSGVGKFGINGEWSFLEFKDSDAFENILRKIEVARVHVSQLRTRIDKVLRENAEKITSENKNFAFGEPLASCGPSSYLPHVKGENVPLGYPSTTSQQTSQKKLVMPERSGYREAETTNYLQVGRKCDKMDDAILVYNQPVKEEPDDIEVVGTRDAAEPQSGIEGKAEIQDPSSPSNMMVTREQLAVKLRSKLITTPKNKRKRGRRKARASRWSRKLSG